VVGAHELGANESSQKRHRVKRVVIHEKYQPNKQPYDIMLLELSTGIVFNDQTKPICVDASVFNIKTKCTVAGWGYTAAFGRNMCTFYARQHVMLRAS